MAPNKKAAEKSLFDTLPEDQKDFFIQSLEKKVRNVNKKLKEIKQLETDRKEGKELKETQLLKISAKTEHNEKLSEIEGIAKYYLEARAENATSPVAAVEAAAPVVSTANAVAQLYFAARYASENNSNSDLTALFARVFADNSAERVDHATAELVAYLNGKRSLIEAAVASTVALDAFAREQIAPVVEEVQQEEPVTQTVEIVSVQFDDVVAVETEEPTEEAAVEAEETAPEAVEAPAEEEPKPEYGRRNEGRGQERGTRGTRGTRVPEPQEQEQQSEAQEGETAQEGQGERRGGRQPRPPKASKTETTEDGWNVVRKAPEPASTRFNNKDNTNGGFNKDRPANGERRPYNPDRKPFDPERKPYDPERKPFNPDRKPYDPERKPYNPDRKPYNKDRPAYGERREQRPANDNSEAAE